MRIIPDQNPANGGIPAISEGPETLPTLQLQTSMLTRPIFGLHGGDNAPGFDLVGYWRILAKHFKLISGCMGIGLVGSLVITLLITPMYRATTSIQIDRNSVNVVKVDNLEANESGDAEFYQTQYELLKSRSLAERVVANLGLMDNTQFVAPPHVGLFQRVVRLFAATNDAVIEYKSDALVRKQVAAAKIAKNLVIDPVRGSRLVLIHYNDPNPELAQLIANGVADNFVGDALERRYNASSYARTFLEERLQQLKAKLEESERDVVAYAEREHIVSADDKQSLAGIDLTAVNSALTAAKAERLRLEQLWALAKTDNIYGLPQVIENKSLQANRERRVALATDYQQKLTVFKPDYPEMVQIKAQIDELDRQAGRVVAVIRESLRTQLTAAVSSEAELERQLDAKKADLLNLRGRSIQYNILQRELDTNRSLYDGILQRYKEIGVSGGLGTNNISIIDKATTPTSPYSPRMWLNIASGLLAGLLGGVGAAFLMEHGDNTIRSPEDLENRLKLSVLGLIPLVPDNEEISELLKDQRSAVSEAYRSLQTTLQFTSSTGMPRSLAITSSRPGEGKSTTSVALARTCATLGLRVLLIDADLRKASLHVKLGLSNGIGLSNYLSGTHQPVDVVQRTDNERLFFMASGPLPPNPADLLAGTKLSSLLTMANDFFDLVIIDAPPVLGLADAPLIGNAAAGTLMVVSAEGTRYQVAQVAINRLTMARSHVIGGILNRFHAKHAAYGYGYGYGYHEDYYGHETAADASKIQPETIGSFPPPPSPPAGGLK